MKTRNEQGAHLWPCMADGADSSPGARTPRLRQVEQAEETGQELFARTYSELRRLAARKMLHEAPGQTLQPTDLVHEAWLRLGGDEQPNWRNRAHCVAAVAETMRRILIDRARRKRAIRHGGAAPHLDINDSALQIPGPRGPDDELLVVHQALDKLAAINARQAELVKLRYFAGLTIREAAAALGISEPTAKRDWAYSRAWLFREIQRLNSEDIPEEPCCLLPMTQSAGK
jgi:RNA polymerase sigma factor (TIGR02999 family)